MPRLANRAARRVAAKKLEAVSKKAEGRYVRALQKVGKDVQHAAMAYLAPRLDGKRADARELGAEFDLVMGHAIAAVPGKVGTAFEQHATALNAANKKALTLMGISSGDLKVGAEIAKRRDENIDLVVKAQRAYADSVKEVFEDPDNADLRVEDLKELLLERGDVSDSRAELIARDQTLKLNGALTEIRQRGAGIDEYIWSTSLDERVRPEHAALEGQRFSWDSPPEPGHPGQDYQCRCVALPVLEETDDEG